MNKISEKLRTSGWYNIHNDVYSPFAKFEKNKNVIYLFRESGTVFAQRIQFNGQIYNITGKTEWFDINKWFSLVDETIKKNFEDFYNKEM